MKNTLRLFVQYLLIPIGTVFLFLARYSVTSEKLNGVEYGELAQIKLEIAFALVIYYALFFALENNWKRYFFAILPIVLFYGFYDYYFISFGKVFKFCDASELPELFDVLPLWQIIAYLAILIFPFFVMVANFSKIWVRWLGPIAVISIIFVFTTFKPSLYLSLFDATSSFGVTQWSDQNTAQNGYFSTTIYFEAKMANDKKMAYQLYGDGEAYEKPTNEIIDFLSKNGNKRNIHIIVLEGFINPQLLTKVSFNTSTYAKEFSALIKNKESALISPVFGGYTAEAEFEILCGAPALHKYSSIEFNSFTGTPTFCLPNTMKQLGYRTVVSNGYKPNFFNEANAYQGTGFEEIYFPRQYAPQRKTYLSLVDKTQYIFDGDLFDQNISFLKSHFLEKDRKPILNYVLGVYGHLPFVIDEKRHPIFIKPTINKREVGGELQRVANQIYYRSQALAKYLDTLIKMDPDSLIIVTGDHLPRLDGTEFYIKMGWRNGIPDAVHQPTSFFFVDGKIVKKDTMHQYDVINTVYDYMTNNQYCKMNECNRTNEMLDNQYNMIMARALR